MPGYLKYRNNPLCHAPKVKTFDDLVTNARFTKADRDALEKVFKDPKDIDLFTGSKEVLPLNARMLPFI